MGATLVVFGVWLKARTEERFLVAELGQDFTLLTAAAFSMLIPFLPHRH